MNTIQASRTITTKRVVTDKSVCIGCKLCEIWCVVEHSQSRDIIKTFKRDTRRPPARIKVEEDYPSTQAVPCRHCDEPACLFSCIAGAISRDPETQAVVIDEEKCLGCWTCVLMCPFGAISRSENSEDRHAVKCDLCGMREIPSCIEHCPNDALSLEEVTL